MRALTLVLALAFAVPASAQTVRYVSDTLEVPMRSGTTTGHRIVRMLDSGTRLEVLRSENESGYSLVRVEGGTQGWVLSRYLMDQPSARERVEAAEAAVAPLQQENAALKEEIRQLEAAQSEDRQAQTALTAENRRLSQELAQIRRTAANALTIDEQNKVLQEEVVNLESSLRVLEQENRLLSDKSVQTRFLAGAGVLFAGLVLGLILPRIKLGRRGSRWGDL